MAYIPDEAIDRLCELSKGARHLYVFLARCRNQKTGRCFPSVMTTQEALDINRSSVFALRKELLAKGWATFDGDDVKNLLGFNSPEIQTVNVVKKADNASPEIQTEVESRNSDCPEIQTTFVDSIEVAKSPEIQTESVQSRNLDSPVQKLGLNSPEIQTPYKEEPAKEPAKGKARQKTVVPSAIAFIRQLTQRYPDKTLWPRITQTLGEDFDEARLTECYENWVSHGWNKMNLVWLFEWYIKGIPQNQNGRANQAVNGTAQVLSSPVVSAPAEWRNSKLRDKGAE